MKYFILCLCVVFASFAMSDLWASPAPLKSDFLKGEFKRDAAQFFQGEKPFDNSIHNEVLGYFLKGHFDETRETLVAEVDVQFKWESQNDKSVALNSRVSRILTVLDPSGNELPYSVDLEKGLLQIDISQILLKPTTDFTLRVRYEVDLSKKYAVRDGIRYVRKKKGDPIQSSVLFTHSEPQAASYWMPCFDYPTQRSYFSTEFKMPAHQSFISNGDLVKNEVSGSIRTMKYSTRYKLPTYIMAFALGEFTSQTRYHGGLPVSIWARRGVPVEWNGMLEQIVRQMTHFEKLLIPYPFEKYAVVLLPAWGGGMENVGITFQAEENSQRARDFDTLGLTAHELGHQWFGDLMTIKNWDDLWIKEGMATLLAEEATRSYEDLNSSGTLFAHEFSVDKRDAVIDPDLKPDDKYTSGPYGRAAWVYSQIRSLVGEERFWGTLRHVLETHAFGSISTDEFLEYWVPALGKSGVERLKKVLRVKGLPEVSIGRLAEDKLSIALNDPTQTLLVPIDIQRYQGNGSYETIHLGHSQTQTISFSKNQFLVIDPQERHPLPRFFDLTKVDKTWGDIFVPKTQIEEDLFFKLGTQFQTLALGYGSVWNWNPAKAEYFLKALPSERAKFQALSLSCETAKKTTGSAFEEWRQVISKGLLNPPYLGIQGFGRKIAECTALFPDGYLKQNLEAIAANPANPNHSYTEYEFYSFFPSEPKITFQTWGLLGKYGPTIEMRKLGVLQLGKHFGGNSLFTKPEGNSLALWKKYFREVITDSDVDMVVGAAVGAMELTQDLEAIPLLATLVRDSDAVGSKKGAVCTAYRLSKGNAKYWTDFVGALGSLSEYASELREVIEKPDSACK